LYVTPADGSGSYYISIKIYNSIMKFNTGNSFSVFSFSNSSLDLENNIIEDNIVNTTSGYAIGCISGNFTSKNNVLIGNTASGIEMDISCFDCYSFMNGAPPSCACPYVNVSTQCTACSSGFNQSLGCADCNFGLFGPTCTEICNINCNGNGYCSSGILGNGACICNVTNYSSISNCSSCITGFNSSGNCQSCLVGFNSSIDCSNCVNNYYGPTCSLNCTVDCNKHGSCNAGISGDGTCHCDLGYNPSDNCDTIIPQSSHQSSDHKSASSSIKSKFILEEKVTLLLFLSIILSIYNRYFSL